MSDPRRRQWEYETLRPPREATKKEAKDSKEELNDLGAEGWEFVQTIEYTGGGTKYLVFKRPAETDDDADDDTTGDNTDEDDDDADNDDDASDADEESS